MQCNAMQCNTLFTHVTSKSYTSPFKIRTIFSDSSLSLLYETGLSASKRRLHSSSKRLLLLTFEPPGSDNLWKEVQSLDSFQGVGTNRPFSSSGHMVQNHTCWDVSCTVGLPKQSNSYQSTLICLCFGSPTVQLASQHVWFFTMWLSQTLHIWPRQVGNLPTRIKEILLISTFLL